MCFFTLHPISSLNLFCIEYKAFLAKGTSLIHCLRKHFYNIFKYVILWCITVFFYSTQENVRRRESLCHPDIRYNNMYFIDWFLCLVITINNICDSFPNPDHSNGSPCAKIKKTIQNRFVVWFQISRVTRREVRPVIRSRPVLSAQDLRKAISSHLLRYAFSIAHASTWCCSTGVCTIEDFHRLLSCKIGSKMSQLHQQPVSRTRYVCCFTHFTQQDVWRVFVSFKSRSPSWKVGMFFWGISMDR